MKSPSINISKIDAAKRQLETAIVLYFSNADPVSIHTLSVASHEIIRVLSESKGIKSAIKNKAFIKKEKWKDYIDLINYSQNFFKHTDKNGKTSGKSICEFKIEGTEFIIFDACEMYRLFTKEDPKLICIFTKWLYFNEPNIIKDNMQDFKKTIIEESKKFDLKNRFNSFQKLSEEYDKFFLNNFKV